MFQVSSYLSLYSHVLSVSSYFCVFIIIFCDFFATEHEVRIIMAFRREKSQVQEYEFELKGIDENAEYQLEDIDLGDLGTVAGKHLVEGFKVQIPEKRATRILFYTKLPTVSTSSS
ncbi:MAG: hypothetical protein ACOX63_12670 [Christensenellales bacterium]